MQSAITKFHDLSLCGLCRLRLGVKSKVGKKKDKDTICYICGGIMERVESLSAEITRKLEGLEFDTFLIGASVPHKILDREDELRSRYKIKGKDSIKSQITKLLSEETKHQTGKKVDFSKPDVTVLVSFTDGEIILNLRSVWLSGSYLKLARGLPQRSAPCNICNGLGCAKCGYKGKSFESVQGEITNFLTSRFSAENCNFIWLGSEDENSLVSGTGRPFFVEITKPKNRFVIPTRIQTRGSAAKRSNRVFFRSKAVQVVNLRLLDRRVTDVPFFEITARIYLKRKQPNGEVDIPGLKLVEQNFSNSLVSVRLSRKFKTVQKEIKSLSCKSLNNGERLELRIDCDGGIPLKKLITGQDDSVKPNLAQFFSPYEIDSQRPFDVLDVRIKERKQKSSTAALNETQLDEQI